MVKRIGISTAQVSQPGPYTRFQASSLPVGRFPLYGYIESMASMLMLANNGTDPSDPERVRPTAEKIQAALRDGRTVSTETAIITPLAAGDPAASM
jgi:hypothetical protein